MPTNVQSAHVTDQLANSFVVCCGRRPEASGARASRAGPHALKPSPDRAGRSHAGIAFSAVARIAGAFSPRPHLGAVEVAALS